MTDAAAVCCFCARPAEPARRTTIVVYPPTEPEESQTLLCHGKCLVERLDPRVPHHPILDDD